MKPVISLDLDGVIYDWCSAYAKLLAEEHGTDLAPVFSSWDWDEKAGYPAAVIERVWKQHIWNSRNFWQGLQPLDGAAEAIRKINWLTKGGKASAYFITNRHGNGAKEQTEKSLYNLGLDYPTVLLAADKVPILKALGAALFVDDKLETVMQAHTEVPNTFLFDQPWNRDGRPVQVPVVTSVREALAQVGLWQE